MNHIGQIYSDTAGSDVPGFLGLGFGLSLNGPCLLGKNLQPCSNTSILDLLHSLFMVLRVNRSKVNVRRIFIIFQVPAHSL